MKANQIELLSPAGSYESFMAAINAGADAVYVGGNKYSARAYAKNFSEEELLAAIDYAHLFGKKVYLTINTLLKNEELSELSAYLNPYYEAGLDAVIVQDLGAITYLRKHYPLLLVHASTQMTITGIEGVRLLEEMGVKRVVLARELSLSEIQYITENNATEIECFIHGALCYCYSGKCLFSSLIGGRSGNRGRCAQPCRLPYDVINQNGTSTSNEHEKFLLSPKDICTIELIPQLIEAGITSFKIEGRMKRAEYVAGVTRIYRKYIDQYLNHPNEKYQVEQTDYDELIQLYTRSGSSKGYYVQKNGRDMITLSKPNYEMGDEARFKELYEQYVNKTEKISVKATITLRVNQKAHLAITCMAGASNQMQAERYGAVVEASQNRPLDAESIKKQIRKSGNTPFTVDDIAIEMDEQIFMPVKALNDLRREVLELLMTQLLSEHRRKHIEPIEVTMNRVGTSESVSTHEFYLTASVETKEVFQSLVSIEAVKDIYVAFQDRESILDALKIGEQYQKNIYLSLPLICRAHTMIHLKQYKELLTLPGLKGILVHNYESLQWLKEQDYQGRIVSDFDLYTFNHVAVKKMNTLGCNKFTASVELNEKELWGMDRSHMEVVMYGYLPMMISAQCIQNTTIGCNPQSGAQLILRDRYGKHLQMQKNCAECYNVIYNSVPLSLHNELPKLMKMGFESYRLRFTKETPEQAETIVKCFQDRLISDEKVTNDFLAEQEYTKGHFSRGVE
ncbi:MAG TPA: U32 family peptidase [Lachnospiraceae bacterium]|nr:U32 family peptidase [Lachnospiraceae bacterium]